MDFALLWCNAHHPNHRSKREFDVIREVGKSVMDGNNLRVRFSNAIAENTEPLGGNHHTVICQINGHNLNAECIANMRAAHIDWTNRAVHNADINVRSLNAFILNLTGVAIVCFHPKYLAVFYLIVGRIGGIKVKDNFVFWNYTHRISLSFLLPACGQDADHGADKIDSSRSKDHDDRTLHGRMCIPAALPFRLNIAFLTSLVNHQNRNDRHNSNSIIAGTILAASALCWAFWSGTVKVDTVPAAAAEGTVSAPCAPQAQPTESTNNIVIEEPVTKSETIPVAGSVDSPAQETPTVVSTSTLAEEAIAEQPATIPEPAPAEEPVAKSSAEETPQPHDGMVYVPGFGYLQSEGSGEWSVSENMYENGNKVGSMG